MELFARRDIDQYADSLAAYMPGGALFASKSVQNSNFRKLLQGMAGELFTANGLLREYSREILPDQTVQFIEEWEKALGIPDDCFSGSGNLNDRRRDILVKLAALGVQTEQDFIDLAALFGIDIDIIHGTETFTFPITFPATFFNSLRESRFTIIVVFTVPTVNRFEYTFPFIFGGEEIGILECLFEKLKPANCKVIFNQI